MNNSALGRLERVQLRDVWGSEPRDFTPWLANEENLALLSETLGLELELESTEHGVGDFRADILCKDTITNNWVLIENQLEPTDHIHLGELITYASGLNAVTIVWIAQRFRDEHRAALDWLNEVTDENINFFGLEIELWRIGNSLVAPKFNIVSQPNDWTKTVTISRQIQTGDSELDQLKLQFWTVFREYLQSHQSILKSQKPSKDHWTNFALGRSYFQLMAAVGMRDGYVSVSMIMTGPNAKAHYHLLERERAVIEAEVGEKLVWRELPNNKQSDVLIEWRGIATTDPSQWATQQAWLREKLEAFHRAFARRIKNLSAADYIPPINQSIDGEL